MEKSHSFRRSIITISLVLSVVLLLSFQPSVMDNRPGCTAAYSSDTIARVQVGVDRLFTEYAYLLEGRKVALVTNHTGRLSDGTHLADALFRSPKTELKVLFGMNFNIRSNDYSLPKDAEKAIDPETGVVKYSLYGKIHKPTKEMLSGVDVIILDIQEVGARFYEHINILGFVMEAAAENQIEVVVLDRPNPNTGLKMDGFLTDDEFLYGFGAFGKVPVIHGMTMGELAKLYNDEGMLRDGLRCKLQVIEMKGWERSMWFDQTGLEWSKPSPNLPTYESMLVYLGTCIFEGLNISTGRGTEKPFQYIGSTWLDNGKVVALLNGLGLKGVCFDTVTFTPVKMPFHSQAPFLAGEECRGIHIRVTDRTYFEPYKTGVSALWAINRVHPDKIEWDFEIIHRLVGTRRLEIMIKQGAHPFEIFESWKKELHNFKETSQKYLIY